MSSVTLFDVFEGIVSSDYAVGTMSSADNVQNYAECMGLDLSLAEAERIIAAYGTYKRKMDGGGEWSLYLAEVKRELESDMFGTVATSLEDAALGDLKGLTVFVGASLSNLNQITTLCEELVGLGHNSMVLHGLPAKHPKEVGAFLAEIVGSVLGSKRPTSSCVLFTNDVEVLKGLGLYCATIDWRVVRVEKFPIDRVEKFQSGYTKHKDADRTQRLMVFTPNEVVSALNVGVELR